MLRALLLATTAILSAAAAAGEVYRWVDENGVVHYTDRPPSPDARPAQLPPIQTVPPRRITTPDADAAPQPSAPAAAADYRIRFVTPQRDEVIRDPNPELAVSVRIEPPLAPQHALRYFLDGKPVNETPTRQTTLRIPEVYRGSHALAVSIVDGDGRIVASSEALPFHKLPPTARGNRPRAD